MTTLDSLSTELILNVFSYLNIFDLCRVKQTCRRFNEILNKWGHLFININEIHVTSQQGAYIRNRSNQILLPFEKLRISRNWRLGRYKETNLLYDGKKYMPWMALERNLLWISRGKSIKAFRRIKKGISAKDVLYKVQGSTKGEICRFTLKNNHLLSGLTDGSIWMWSLDERKFVFELENCHQSDINDVDFCDSFVVTGSRDNSVKIWNRAGHMDQVAGTEFCFNDRIWCLTLNQQNKSLLAIGRGARPKNIVVQDVHSQTFIAKLGFNWNLGTLHLKWENPNLLWSSGYGGFLCRWDLRMDGCVQSFADPLGSAIYCFDCDFNNTVICGTQTNGRAVLFDTRLKYYVNMYFMECCRNKFKSSPIYSLSFDPKFLFTATDEHINVLNYSAHGCKERDYTNFMFTSDLHPE